MGPEEADGHQKMLRSTSSMSTSDGSLPRQAPISPVVSEASHPMHALTPNTTRLVSVPPRPGEAQRSADFAVKFGVDGSAYAGGVNFDGLRYGFGVLFEDACIFEGEFEGGKKHGLGVELTSEEVFAGRFMRGRRVAGKAFQRACPVAVDGHSDSTYATTSDGFACGDPCSMTASETLTFAKEILMPDRFLAELKKSGATGAQLPLYACGTEVWQRVLARTLRALHSKRMPLEKCEPDVNLREIRCEETGAEGGNGIIHHAEYRGMQVVTKVSRGGCGNDILKEARILRGLEKHDNIVEYVGLCEDREAGPVLLLLREPWTLYEVIHVRGSRLDAGFASAIGAGIAAGVEHLHAAGIAHLDLKSSNVLLSCDLVPRLCDFGHAANRKEGEVRPHIAIGTPVTAAPEVLLEVGVGLSADVWSIGVILAEMLMQQMPFQDFSYAQVVIAVIYCVEPVSADVDAPTAYRELVKNCLRRSPAERPSARDIKNALQKLCPQEPLTPDKLSRCLPSSTTAAFAAMSQIPRPSVGDIGPCCFSWLPSELRCWMPRWLFA
jgi:tRNA A-37 threonylcarbamoyl transferase component Bud32